MSAQKNTASGRGYTGTRLRLCLLVLLLSMQAVLVGCAPESATWETPARFSQPPTNDPVRGPSVPTGSQEPTASAKPQATAPQQTTAQRAEELRLNLGIVEDLRPGFDHGPKPVENQRYVVLHDTEGTSDPASVIAWWDGNGNLVAAHFVVGMDGSIWQCVPLDRIAHHAGFGDVGHNELYGLEEDGRDDMLGSVPLGPAFPCYGMNASSIGIEMVHVGGSGFYPEEQLAAVDALIAYLDAVYAAAPEGNAGVIVDHKAWRSGNSDTSPEFAGYLASYQQLRRHA